MSHLAITRLFPLACVATALGVYGCAQDTPTSSTLADAGETTVSHQPSDSASRTRIQIATVDREEPQSLEQAKATLKAIKGCYQGSVPRPINGNFTCDQVDELASNIGTLHAQLAKDVAWLKSVDATKLSGADRFTAQAFSNSKVSLLSRLENSLPRELDHVVAVTREALTLTIEAHLPTIQRAADVDMEDQFAVRNLLSDERNNRVRDETIALLDSCYDSLIALEKAFDEPKTWMAKRQQYHNTLQVYRDKISRAADAIFPPRDINDAQLATVAAEVFANPQLKLPDPTRIIVNAPKQTRSEVKVTTDWSSGTISRTNYRWEEFQAASIERDGELYYLWYNTFLRYSEGPHTVPVGKWVMGPRHRSAAISETNIGR